MAHLNIDERFIAINGVYITDSDVEYYCDYCNNDCKYFYYYCLDCHKDMCKLCRSETSEFERARPNLRA